MIPLRQSIQYSISHALLGSYEMSNAGPQMEKQDILELLIRIVFGA